VLLVDLDDFTAVNDTHGLSVGDQVLSAVAERLRACLEPGDTAARLGGDEFGILLEATTRADAVALAERIEASLRVPFAVASAQLPLRASIGIALAERRHSSVEELVRNADAALYAAKRAARTKHAVFETRMLDAVIGRYALLSQLPSAIHGPQLVLRYQPIFDLRTGELAGLEALVRWQHPQLGLIGPDRFIPLAEESNLILALDLWVLREACSQLLRWRADSGDLGELYMSVNLSRAHFADSEFPSTILNVLQEVGMSPSQLVLEITESAVVRDLKAAQETLLPLRGLGARVAIDDFGTGYSSLSALHDFPVDMLKLAKPLVDKAADAGRGEALILAVTGLAQALSLNVVAEGIESAAQVDALRALGCDGGQGFYLAQPLEAAGVEALLGGRRLKNGSKIRIAG
jgi:diguanylate cyclase (GGDEF)-like protein